MQLRPRFSSSGIAVVAFSLVLASGCFAPPEVQETRMGNYPARSADCQLAFIQVDSAKGMPHAPDGSQYEMASAVHVWKRADPNDPAVHALVRPHACAMGGDAISLSMSSERQMLFTVWARHVQQTSKTF